MKLLGSTNSKVTKDVNKWKCVSFRITEGSTIAHCNIINDDYQQDSRFVPNKSFGQLLDVAHKYFHFEYILDSYSDL